ncbi:MAG: transporter substrate-binding domain-containing protein [Methyloprofundus sp.]|nr:transporter substrate-binding domain-containing protein [Methyloprofundus sp.]
MKNLILIICLFVTAPLHAQQTLVFSTLDLNFMVKINRLIFTEVYQRLGIDIVIQIHPAERALHLANSGAVDGDLIRAAMVSRIAPNLIRIPTSFFQGKTSAFSKNKNIVLKGWQDLKPYRVAILRGHKIAEIKTRGLNVEAINTPEELFYFLDRGRADIVIFPYIIAPAYLKKLKLNNIYTLSPPLEEASLYHFLHKKHANLVPKVDHIIQQLLKEGFIDNMTQQVLAEIK